MLLLVADDVDVAVAVAAVAVAGVLGVVVAAAVAAASVPPEKLPLKAAAPRLDIVNAIRPTCRLYWFYSTSCTRGVWPCFLHHVG